MTELPRKLASCIANMSKFHVVFSSSTLITLNKDAFEGHLCQPLIIVSQYSTGPQHNMGCKYNKFASDLFVSFYWYIYTLGCRQLVVETDFRRAPPEYG